MPLPKKLSLDDVNSFAQGAPKKLSLEEVNASYSPPRQRTGATDSWDEYKPDPSAMARGAAQGATFGFADEIEGAGRAAIQDVAFGPSKLSELPERYAARRDASRAEYERAREESPGSYTAGEVAGGIGTAFIPGLGWANAAKVGMIPKIVQGAKIGAVQGLGTSTSDLTKGQFGEAAEDVGTGAALGGATAGVVDRAGAVLKGITPTSVAKKLSNVFLNTPEEITETYVNNPQGVLNAPKRHELATEYQGLLDKLKGDVQGGSKESRKILENEGLRFKGSEIAKILDDKANEIEKRMEGVWDNPEQLAAYKWLKDTADQYRSKAVPGKKGIEVKDLSANRIKDMLQGIDRSTEFETAPGKFSAIDDLTKKDVRAQIDAMLKGRSPAYQEQMKGVAVDTALLDEASNIARSPQGLANVFRRVETDQYGGGQAPREVLEQFGKRMGTDILEKAKLATAKEAFDKSVTNGSRNVQFFSNWLKDVPVAKYAAPIIGGSVDKYGRKLTMSAVDAAAALNKAYQSSSPKFRADVEKLMDLAAKGNPTAILTFQLLSQSNPEALKHLNQGEPVNDK